MASKLILSVQEGSVSFGTKVIFDNLSFNIHEGDKICLVGKNGAGKTTLMNIITGDRDLDSGKRWQLHGVTIGYLQQDITPKPGETVYDFVFEQLKKEGIEEFNQYKVEMVIQPLDLKPDDKMDMLSGGQLRRAALARALVEEPDILMLDEPTNHLDLDVIEWLETFLKQYRGALLCVSHDKQFLATVSDKIFWLDRGMMRVAPKGFAYFDEWSGGLIEQEERELKNRQKHVDLEVEWASRGPKARRKRNIRRLEIMHKQREKLKRDIGSYRQMMRKIHVGDMDTIALGPHVVAEFFKVDKSFIDDKGREKKILDKFNLRITRGDRIGLLGKNGSGKTTFLKMLIGEMQPDMGKVKLARDLEFSYFDQKRRDLNPQDTVQRTLCPQGGEYVKVLDKTRHVIGYLKDFMFEPSLVDQKVSTLSGGQKNRLLLAKTLANPKGLLILDEPTNDLDMDTLDMLEEILTEYTGTLIVVSHDRDFLDQSVSKILAFEGDAIVDGYIGGYSDYLSQRDKRHAQRRQEKEDDGFIEHASAPAPRKEPRTTAGGARPLKKLTYKIQYEFDNLPTRIADLEKQIAEFEDMLDDATLFERDRGAFDTASKRLAESRGALESAELRWLEIDEMRQQFDD